MSTGEVNMKKSDANWSCLHRYTFKKFKYFKMISILRFYLQMIRTRN